MSVRSINASDVQPEYVKSIKRFKRAPLHRHRDPIDHSANIARFDLTRARTEADNRDRNTVPLLPTPEQLAKQREDLERSKAREKARKQMAVRLISANAMKPPKTTGGLVANLTDVNDAWTMVKQGKVTKDNPLEVELEPATVEFLKKANPNIKPVNAAVNLFRRRFNDEGLPYRAFANAGEKAVFTIMYHSLAKADKKPAAKK